jgi:hypothetical protein
MKGAEEMLWEEEQFPSPQFGPLEEGSDDTEKLRVFSSFALVPPKLISESLYVPPMPTVPQHERVVHVHDEENDDDDDDDSELDTFQDLKKSHRNWDSEVSFQVDNSFKDWNDFSLDEGGSSSPEESVVSRESSEDSLQSIGPNDHDCEEGSGEDVFAFLKDDSDDAQQYIQETLALAAIRVKEEDAKRQQCKQCMMEVKRLIQPLQPLRAIKECSSLGWDTDEGSNNHDSANSNFSLVSLVERSQDPMQTTITEGPLSPHTMHTTRTTPGKMSPIEELREKVIQQKERTRLLKERSYAILAKAARRRGARPERSITYQSRRQNVLHDLQELNRSSEEKRQHNIAMRENSTPLYLKPRLTPPNQGYQHQTV